VGEEEDREEEVAKAVELEKARRVRREVGKVCRTDCMLLELKKGR
jgi:hypothetical protein